MKKRWAKVAVLLMLVGPLALMVACGDDDSGENGSPGENGITGENGDPGGNSDPGGNGDPGGTESIPEQNFFDEDEWNYYVAEIESEAEVITRTWGYSEDGTRGGGGTGTIRSDHGRAFGTGRSIEDFPSFAFAAWLTEGSGPATLMLYKGHELADEVTLSEVGERDLLVGGQVVAHSHTDPVAVSGEPDSGEFIGSFSGLGYNMELQGDVMFGPGSNSLEMDVDSATVDGSTVNAAARLRFNWNGDLAAGTYSSEDEEDTSGLSMSRGHIRWGDSSMERIDIEYCEVLLEVTTPCDFDNNCAGEATVTNCRADKRDLDDTFPITAGFADISFRFNPTAP